jgi:hypothetical protein
VCRVRGVGSGVCGRRHNVAAQFVGLENPPVAEVRANTASGSCCRSTSRPTRARRAQSVRGRTAHRHADRAARSGSIKTSSRPHHRLPGRNLPTRMTRCASPPEKQCRAVATIRHALRLRKPTRVLPDPACRSSTSVTRRARRRSDPRPTAPGCGRAPNQKGAPGGRSATRRYLART